MLMALAAQHDMPCVFLPGGVTLSPLVGEDAGRVQTLSVRFALGEVTLEQASILGCPPSREWRDMGGMCV